jgi:putative oxidoreductase
MASPIVSKWQGRAPELLGVLRVMGAFTFMLSGTVKLFEFPMKMPAAITVPMLSELWFAGVLEVFGGGLLLVGLFTRPVAFLLAGEMALAYFQFHVPRGFWPVVNGGTDAVLYCFLWLFISAAGAGSWSLDGVRSR